VKVPIQNRAWRPSLVERLDQARAFRAEMIGFGVLPGTCQAPKRLLPALRDAEPQWFLELLDFVREDVTFEV
jgi:hypothetical protein